MTGPLKGSWKTNDNKLWCFILPVWLNKGCNWTKSFMTLFRIHPTYHEAPSGVSSTGIQVKALFSDALTAFSKLNYVSSTPGGIPLPTAPVFLLRLMGSCRSCKLHSGMLQNKLLSLDLDLSVAAADRKMEHSRVRVVFFKLSYFSTGQAWGAWYLRFCQLHVETLMLIQHLWICSFKTFTLFISSGYLHVSGVMEGWDGVGGPSPLPVYPHRDPCVAWEIR